MSEVINKKSIKKQHFSTGPVLRSEFDSWVQSAAANTPTLAFYLFT